jgi:hypothetical protein
MTQTVLTAMKETEDKCIKKPPEGGLNLSKSLFMKEGLSEVDTQ